MKTKVKELNFLSKNFYILHFYYKYVKFGIFIIIFFSILAGFLESIGISLLFPVFQSLITNSVELKLPSTFNKAFQFFNIKSDIRTFLLFFILLFFLKAVVKFFTGYLKVYYSGKFLLDLRVNLINSLINYDYDKFTKKDTGKISSLLTMEVEKLLSGFLYFCNYLVTVFTGLSFVLVIFFMNYKFALIIILFGVIYYSLFRKSNLKIKNLSSDITLNNSNFNSLLIQFVQSFKYLKTTNNFYSIKKILNESVSIIRKKHLQKDTRTNIIAAVQEPATLLILAFIVFFAINVIRIDATTSILILLLFYRSTSYFISSQSIWNTFLSQIGSTNSVINFERELENHKEVHTGTIDKMFKEGILFKDVSFCFESNQIVLDKINFQFDYNKTTAIVGKSGGGKSTLINLISGLFLPNSGDIFVDGIAMNMIDIKKWRSKIGIITQESVIFNDSILNNITLWNYDKKRDKQKLLNIIKTTHLDDFILSEEDLNRVVGDRGISLSGGQKQRIAIARELYKEPQILILDEATSALDSETENFINKSIEALNGNITLIIIAHRLATIKNADKIAVLEQGRIVESGKYNELISQSNSMFNTYLKYQSL